MSLSHKRGSFGGRPTGLLLVGLAVAVMLFAGLGAIDCQAQEKVIKIGLPAMLTGPDAANGEEFIRSYKVAIKEVNDKGGVHGYKFELVTADTKDMSPDAVMSAVKKLIDTEGVEVCMTGWCSTNAFEVHEFAKAQMVYLIWGICNEFKAQVQPSPEKFPTVWCPAPDLIGYENDVLPAIMELVQDGKITLRNKKIALVTTEFPYSFNIYNGLIREFTKAGWTVSFQEVVPLGPINDWRVILNKMRKDDPDLIVDADHLPGNGAAFIEQFLEEPTNSLVFIQYAPSVSEFRELTKEKSNGVIYTLITAALPNPQTDHITGLFREMWPDYAANVYNYALYEQFNVYIDALQKVGDPKDHLAIGRAIGETKKQLCQGYLEFDHKTHLGKAGPDYLPTSFWQLWDGKEYLWTPKKYATGEWKLPPWFKE